MRAAPWAVVVPAPEAFPSGGNVFNARVLAGLRAGTGTVHRVKAGEPLPAFEPDARVLLDTLLLAQAEAPLARVAERGLLVHYLELFDRALRDGAGAQDERRLIAGYTRFVATSRWSANALRALGVRGAIDVVHPGLDPPFLDLPPPPRDARDRTRVLTVANLIAVKGLLELARVLAELIDLPFEWTVAGSARLDPGYAARFAALCRDCGLADRTHVIEAPPDAMRALYDQSDLLLSGARFETLGMALREAMARALPVLGWDVGGCGESVRDGETGYLVRFGDEARFADRLRALIEQPPLRRALGAAGRVHAASFPTWEQAQARFADVLAAD